MTARLGSEYRYFGKLVLVPFRYFSIDIYRNIDIFDNTTMVACYSEFSHSVVRGDIWINDNGMIKIGPQARNQFARSTIALYA